MNIWKYDKFWETLGKIVVIPIYLAGIALIWVLFAAAWRFILAVFQGLIS